MRRPVESLAAGTATKPEAVDEAEPGTKSATAKGRPFVALNTMKSGERGRTDASHELGHFVLHRDVEVIGKDQEDEAQTFAGAFLLPTPAVRATGMRNPRLDQVLTVKAAWQVSATMFVRRLADVGLLGGWSYRTLVVELSQRGFRSGEPDGIPRETSQLLASALKALRAEGKGVTCIAELLHLDPDEVREYLFGLVLI